MNTWNQGRIIFLLCLGSVTSPITISKRSFNKNDSNRRLWELFCPHLFKDSAQFFVVASVSGAFGQTQCTLKGSLSKL